MARQTDSITVNRSLFDQVVESLCLASDDTHIKDSLEHEQRQQALLELYSVDGLDYFNTARLMDLARDAGFYRVCELIYARRGDFAETVACYWRDAARQQQVFS